MTIHKIKNFFSDEEISLIKSSMNKNKLEKDENGNYLDRTKHPLGYGIDYKLGRLQYGIEMTEDISKLIEELRGKINKLFNLNLHSSGFSCAEYSAEFGTPNLPIHWDHDRSEMIFNYQLSSTTSWDIGIDKTIYSMEDNSALIFNPNKYTHWRPHKTFKEGESVTMIFFRFLDPNNISDYSHLDYTIGHPIFKEIEEFRESLRET